MITFCDIKIEKLKFNYHKKLIFLDVDIDNILISSMTSSGEENYK